MATAATARTKGLFQLLSRTDRNRGVSIWLAATSMNNRGS